MPFRRRHSGRNGHASTCSFMHRHEIADGLEYGMQHFTRRCTMDNLNCRSTERKFDFAQEKSSARRCWLLSRCWLEPRHHGPKYLLASTLARRRALVWSALCQTAPVQSTCGSAAIGIQTASALPNGTKATGRGLPMRALVGLNLTTTASNFLMGTGMEIAAGWNTITAGTTTATGTTIATATIIMDDHH